MRVQNKREGERERERGREREEIDGSIHIWIPVTYRVFMIDHLKSDFLKLSPPRVAREFLFARRNLVLALMPLFLGQFGQTKVLRPVGAVTPFCRKVRASGGCHAQIRRPRDKKGVTTSKNPTLNP
eukprot:sb/3475524/